MDQDAATDAAIRVLSEAMGEDLDFEIGNIFSPALWHHRQIGELLTSVGISPDMGGNKMALYKNKKLVSRLRKAPVDDPLRVVALQSGFGLVPYDVGEPDGFDAGKLGFQFSALLKIAMANATPEENKYAVYELMKWTHDLMRGDIEMKIPGCD
jgi:hypothetical protein